VSKSKAAMTPPASHWAAEFDRSECAADGNEAPVESKFQRVLDIAANQVILAAMKKYGLILADNGSSMYISGAPDDRWDNNDLHNLEIARVGL